MSYKALWLGLGYGWYRGPHVSRRYPKRAGAGSDHGHLPNQVADPILRRNQRDDQAVRSPIGRELTTQLSLDHALGEQAAQSLLLRRPGHRLPTTLGPAKHEQAVLHGPGELDAS